MRQTLAGKVVPAKKKCDTYNQAFFSAFCRQIYRCFLVAEELKLSFSGKNLSLTSLQDKWEQLNYNLTLLTLYSPAS